MKYLWFAVVMSLALVWCTYVRPPAWNGVKEETPVSGTAVTGTAVTGTAAVTGSMDMNWTGGYVEYVTPERAKPIIAGISLPAGFSIHVFAQVPNARSLAVAYDEERNRQIIFVWTKEKWSVYALIDEWANNTVDHIKEVAKNLKQPNGVAFKDWNLYVAEVSQIREFTAILNTLADTKMNEPADFVSTIVYDNLPDDAQHWWKYIAFWPDGDLYIPVGVPCNICDEPDPYGSIMKLNISTKESQIVARWVRNTVGFSWHPETQQLWFTDNGRDNLGNDLPHDELNVVTKTQEHFGFPYCYDDGKWDPNYKWKDCTQYTEPQVQLWPHVAALWMKFYTGNMFPENYRNKIFIAEHGSRNRNPPLWYRISLADTDNKTYEIFAEGWLRDGKTWGRPVDVLELKNGSLLVSDDYAGLVYIILYNQ